MLYFMKFQTTTTCYITSIPSRNSKKESIYMLLYY